MTATLVPERLAPKVGALLPGTAEYAAFYLADGTTIALSAHGEAPTPGHEPVLRVLPVPAINPVFGFGFVAPDDLVAQVRTPFWITRRFSFLPDQATCQVRDADGSHSVPIHAWIGNAVEGETVRPGSRTGYGAESFEEAFADAIGKFGAPGGAQFIVLAQGQTHLRATDGTRRTVFFVTVGSL